MELIMQEYGYTGSVLELLRYYAKTHTPAQVATFAPFLQGVRPVTARLMLNDLRKAAQRQRGAGEA